MRRIVLSVVLAAAALAAPGADARNFVGFSIAAPLGPPPPVVYAPPPVVYAYPPPPVVYGAPPVGYGQPPGAYPTPAPGPIAKGQTCREYQSGATIGGQVQQTVGVACLQPDGTWRIVR